MTGYFEERFRKTVAAVEAQAQEAFQQLRDAPANARYTEPDSPTKAQRVLDALIEQYTTGASARRARLQAAIDEQLADIPRRREALRHKHLTRVSKALGDVGLVEFFRAEARRLVDAGDWKELLRRYHESDDDTEIFSIELYAPAMLGDRPERALFGPIEPEGAAELADWQLEVASVRTNLTRLADPAMYQIEIERRYHLGQPEADTFVPSAAGPVSADGVQG